MPTEPTDLELGDMDDMVAVVGMAGRFPGAGDVESLASALRGGSDLTGRTTPGLGVFPTEHFGWSKDEATRTDPQHRMFLLEAWRAVESWGHPPGEHPGVLGVFGSASIDQYANHRLTPAGLRAQYPGAEYLALRTAHHLRASGPCMAVQAACAGGLVAVAQAVGALLDFRCDAAVVGAASVSLPEHRYDPALLSPDGRTQAYAADAQGAGFASGAAVLVLRRLTDALTDGDRVHAVLRGCAVTNDGHRGAGFTAPSVQGQAEAVAEALAVAGVEPEQVDHIEGHGSGTAVGDAVEIAALHEAMPGAHQVGLSSLKATLGHLDTAAGPASLIKAVLMVRDGFVPVQPRFATPMPALEASPFSVPGVTGPAHRAPEVVGVSSFGLGGANAHVVVQRTPGSGPGRHVDPAVWESTECWVGSRR